MCATIGRRRAASAPATCGDRPNGTVRLIHERGWHMSGDERDDERPVDAPPQGSMRFQDETSRPREPTLAERKAREQAERRQREAEEQAEADAERSRKKPQADPHRGGGHGRARRAHRRSATRSPSPTRTYPGALRRRQRRRRRRRQLRHPRRVEQQLPRRRRLLYPIFIGAGGRAVPLQLRRQRDGRPAGHRRHHHGARESARRVTTSSGQDRVPARAAASVSRGGVRRLGSSARAASRRRS